METMLVSMDERTLTRSCMEAAKVDGLVRLLMTVLFNNVFESKLYQLLYDTAFGSVQGPLLCLGPPVLLS